MNEEYVKAYIAAINAELQTKVLEAISLKAQQQMLKDANRAQEEKLIELNKQLVDLKEQYNQVVYTTEETYANAVQVTSGKKKKK
jgi:hypothetical protein|tara:strand:+ start:143 stop:397 length:255 start_codon:yes stop_codon:yes gene_type:complete